MVNSLVKWSSMQPGFDVTMLRKWLCWLHLTIEASAIEALKETFPSNSEEEIAQALENTSSRNEAAENLLAAFSSSEPSDGICRYVIQTERKGGQLRYHLTCENKPYWSLDIHLHGSRKCPYSTIEGIGNWDWGWEGSQRPKTLSKCMKLN